jgi:hypothetical protein
MVAVVVVSRGLWSSWLWPRHGGGSRTESGCGCRGRVVLGVVVRLPCCCRCCRGHGGRVIVVVVALVVACGFALAPRRGCVVVVGMGARGSGEHVRAC